MQPSIAFIVATKNPGPRLASCLESIWTQTGIRREVAVVDAQSTDGTVHYLRSVSPKLDFWVSEPDKGIYDAWNKAIDNTRSPWLLFLGSDDRLFSADTAAAVLSHAERTMASLVTGRAIVVDSQGSALCEIGAEWSWARNRSWQRVVHTGALHSRELFSRYGPFDAGFRISGDYEFLLRLDKSESVSFYPGPIVLMGSAGLSRTNVGRVFREDFAAHSRHLASGRIGAYSLLFIKQAKRFARASIAWKP